MLPLYKKFFVDQQYFIYDTATNHIVEVDENIYNNFEDVFSSGMLENDVETYSSLLEMRNKFGLFPDPPKSVRIGNYSTDSLKEILSGGLNLMQLEVVQDCNFRCSYCFFGGGYEYQRPHQPQTMSKKTAEDALQFYLRHSSQKVALQQKYHYTSDIAAERLALTFTGGEPLLNFDVIKYAILRCEEIFADPVSFNMTTNGLLLDGEIADFLLQHNVSITVSLDGPEHLHNRYRRDRNGQGTHSRIMENLRRFQEKYTALRSDLFFSINCTLAEPIDFLELHTFFHELQLDLPMVKVITTSGVIGGANNEYSNTISVSPSLPNNYLKLRDDYWEKYGKSVNRSSCDDLFLRNLLEPPLRHIGMRSTYSSWVGANFKSGPCTLGLSRPLVTLTGDIFPCERIRMSDEFCVGNIYTGFDIEKINAARDSLISELSDECCKCWCVHLCEVCHSHVTCFEGGRMTVSKDACDETRAMLEIDMAFYLSFYKNNPERFIPE